MAKKFEEENFPDDFDVAYAQFASSMGRPEASDEPEADEQQPQAVLNKREYHAFSQFLDHVLVDPSAARKDEVHWLDLSMYNGNQPTGLYVPLARAGKNKQEERDRPVKRPKSNATDSFEEPFVLPVQSISSLKPNPLLSAANAPTPELTDEDSPHARMRQSLQSLQGALSSTSAPLKTLDSQHQFSQQATAGPGPSSLPRPPSAPIGPTNGHMGPSVPANRMPGSTAPMGAVPRPPIGLGMPAPGMPGPGMPGPAAPPGEPAQPRKRSFATAAPEPGRNPMLSLHVAATSDFYRGFVEPPQINTNKGVDDLIQAHIVAQRHRELRLPLPEELEAMKSSASEGSPAGSRSSEDAGRRRREYLSVDQVRQNHINSEKRRRDHIKQLFSELCSLLPSISQASGAAAPPKSVVIQAVYRFLVETAEQNRQIRRVLVRSGARTDHIPAFKLDPPLPDLPDTSEEPASPIY